MAKIEWLTARKPEPYYLPTPSVGVTRALGGKGLASGRIHTYWGPKASGKTTFALQQIAAAQKEGKICAFLDAEKSFSPEWAELNGVDVDALKYQNTLIVEEALELLLPDMSKGVIDLLVVDSINTLTYKDYLEKHDSNAIGTYARSAKFFTHKLLNALQYHQEVILISQAAMKKQGTYFNLGASVGSSIEHWSSTMIRFAKYASAKEDLRADGSFRVQWTIDKSKQSLYPVKGSYFFNPKTAEIDTIGEIAIAVVEEGIVEVGGKWHYYPSKVDKQYQWDGAANFLQAIKGDLGLQAELIAKLNAIEVKVVEDEDSE